MIDHSLILAAIDYFRQKKILCIGDVMLDRYVYGQVERISPEAPIPVLSTNSEEIMLGAAGNVAKNIAALGAKVEFYTAIGNDHSGLQIQRLLINEPNIVPYLTTHKEKTTTKTRYMAQSQQILRVDEEEIFYNYDDVPVIDKSIDAVIISDYCKGMLNYEYAKKIIEKAVINEIPVVVDSKSHDFVMFSGATVITPNLGELAGTISWFRQNGTDEQVIDAAAEVILTNNIKNVLVTRASKGMTLQTLNNHTYHIPANAREVFDVVGAGDTVAALIALGLSSGLSVYESSYLANIAGGIVVGKRGTAIVTPQELKKEILLLMDKCVKDDIIDIIHVNNGIANDTKEKCVA